MSKFKPLFLIALFFSCVLAGFFTYKTQLTHADGAVYYFNNAVSTDPGDLGNYWNDENATDPALSLPNFTDDQVTVLQNATFNGDITFNGNSRNLGTVTGNATLKDTSVNSGIISGNANMYDGTRNEGTIQGNAILYEDGPVLDNEVGTVNGTRTHIYTTANFNYENFADGHPWIVIADGVTVNAAAFDFDTSTIFKRFNGGDFSNIAVPYRYYFNNAVSTDPGEQGNYWQDAAFTEPAPDTPDSGKDYLFVTAGSTYEGDAIFRGVGRNDGTVHGDANFYNDLSENAGIVTGELRRTYTESIVSSRDFTANGPWLIVLEGGLDGIIVDISAGKIGFDTTFSIAAGSTLRKPPLKFYFNNAVNTDPTELGNYWQNQGATIAVPFLPDVNIDEVNILAGATYNGDAFLRVYAVNQGHITGNVELYNQSANNGTISGNAIFYNSGTINNGTVSGTKTRHYTESGAPTFNFVTGGPWTVIADFAFVNIYQAVYDNSTVFSAINGGYFLDGKSTDIPTSDPDFQSASYVTVLNGKVYTAGSGRVVVMDTKTHAIDHVIVIPAGTDLYMGVAGNKLYIPNGSNRVSVVDTATNTVTATLTVGNGAKTVTTNGVKLYVTNQFDDSVSVIDSRTDTVVATVPVGDRPFYASTLGTKVYVSNNGPDQNDRGWSVSVINTATDTVEATIPAGHETVLQAFAGTKLFVSNKLGNSMTVIDTTNNSVLATISPGFLNPEMPVVVGNKLYVNNRAGDAVTVVNTTTNAVIASIPVKQGPYYLTAVDNLVFIANESGNSVSVIDSRTDTVIRSVETGGGPFYPAGTHDEVYVPNQSNGFISVIKISELRPPELVSFSSPSPNGTYTVGRGISIIAHFNRSLRSGSTMTVRLNTGASVVLDAVSGSTLSGSYTVGAGDATPDLAVSSIINASVTDTDGHYRTSYDMPFSAGNFTGENSLISRNIGDAKDIVIGSYKTISVGDNPYQVSSPVTVNGIQYVYVANQGSGTVSVVRVSDNVVTATISVGSEPYGMAPAVISGVTYMYVANTNSNTVSVINTATNAVVATIPVGLKPYYAAAIGTNVYVTNGQSNTVSVINANNNTVTATIPVGSYPRGIKAFGTDLYVADYGDPYYYSGGNSVSVINSLNNTVTNTIIMPAGSLGARGVAVSADRVYVTNYRTHNVSVINPTTKAIIATIPVGNGPRGIAVVGTKLYVENFDDGTISIVDTTNNTVTATINAGHSPAGLGVVGTDLYVSRFQDNVLSILDTATNTLKSVSQASQPSSSSGSSGSFIPPSTLVPSSETPPAPAVDVCQGTSMLDQIACEASKIAAESFYAIERFILLGTDLTRKLGIGERRGVINSFKAAFGHEPKTEADWSDVIKLSTGRWPNQRNAEAESRAAQSFKSIYLRDPEMSNPRDSAAIMMMAYGLRPVPREPKRELIAIRTYIMIFRKLPLTTEAWDIIRAIGYSGARR